MSIVIYEVRNPDRVIFVKCDLWHVRKHIMRRHEHSATTLTTNYHLLLLTFIDLYVLIFYDFRCIRERSRADKQSLVWRLVFNSRISRIDRLNLQEAFSGIPTWEVTSRNAGLRKGCIPVEISKAELYNAPRYGGVGGDRVEWGVVITEMKDTEWSFWKPCIGFKIQAFDRDFKLAG